MKSAFFDPSQYLGRRAGGRQIRLDVSRSDQISCEVVIFSKQAKIHYMRKTIGVGSVYNFEEVAAGWSEDISDACGQCDCIPFDRLTYRR